MLNALLARPAAARCLPFAVFIVGLSLRGALSPYVDHGVLYALQAGTSALALALLWRRYEELRPWPVDATAIGASVVLGVVVAALWVSLDAPWMRLGEPVAAFVPVDAEGRLRWEQIGLRLAGACLVVPLVEELFWRSFLMRWWDRRDFLRQPPQQTSLLALLVSSAVFALAHDQWLAGLIAGVLFGVWYRQTGQLWLAIVAHAVANLALGIYVVQQRAWQFW